MNIGMKIKKIRKEKGMTLKQIADAMGCSPQHISQYENGKRLPKIETLMRISQALNINIEELANTDASSIIDIREPSEKCGFDRDNLSKDRVDHAFKKLNTAGKEEAAKRVEELTEISRYTKPEEPQFDSKVTPMMSEDDPRYVNAAHAIDGASEEDKQFDEDIMDDENF